jgi:glucuronate isomerase
MHDPTLGEFLNDGYLPGSATARRLQPAIRDLPILDAHNHADLAEIVDNRPGSHIWQMEGATDHPTVHLPYHERVREETEQLRILPTRRPDKAMDVERDTWRPLVERLARKTELDTSTFEGFAQALRTSVSASRGGSTTAHAGRRHTRGTSPRSTCSPTPPAWSPTRES